MRALARRTLIGAAMILPLGGRMADFARADETAPAAAATPETSVATEIGNGDRMVVHVMIGGGGPYPFIVDTAAERSVIAIELAEQLGLEETGRSNILSMTDRRGANLVRIPALSFLPGESRDLQAFTLRGEHVGAAGVLGIDALRGQRVVLDFEAQQLRVGPAPRRTHRVDSEEIVVRARLRYGQLVLADADVDGARVEVIVDSGLAVSVGNSPLERLLTDRRSRFTDIAITSITGETLHARYTQVDRLRIGSAAINGLPVAFADTYFFRRMQMTRRPALLLGMDALQLFRRVSVDFPNRVAHFVLPESARRPPL